MKQLNKFSKALDHVVGVKSFTYPTIIETLSDDFNYLAGWDAGNIYEITVDSSKIDATLTHFPIPIVLGSAQSDFFDEIGYESNVCEEGFTIGQENPSYTGGAFDGVLNEGNATGCWYAFASVYVPTGWTGQDFGEGNEQQIGTYRISAFGAGHAYNPKSWTFEGSDTGSWAGEEVVLDTQSNQSFASTDFVDYIIATPQQFRYYRIDVTENNGDATYCVIREIEMISYAANLRIAITDSQANQLYVEQVEFETGTTVKDDVETTRNLGGDDDGLATMTAHGTPVDNDTYYTFDGSTNGLYKGSDAGDSATEVCFARVRIHDKDKGTDQIIWKDGGYLNGVAIGIDASGNLGIFGRSTGSLTSITIPSSQYENDVWYDIYFTRTAVVIVDVTTQFIIASKTGTCASTNGSANESLGMCKDQSPITGTDVQNVQFFDGDIATVEVYTEGDLEFNQQIAIYHVSRSDLELSSSEDTKLYLYYDNSQEDNHEYVGEASDLNAYTAKSVVIDGADNYGFATSMGIRSVEFYYRGVLIEVLDADITCYATSSWAPRLPEHVFDTSLLKTGTYAGNGWISASGNPSNQRLICVFDTEITFDQVVVNNQHSTASQTDIGFKNTKIYISSSSITSTVYDEAIADGVEIFDGQFPQHRAYDVIDDQIIPLVNLKPLPALEFTAKSVILDIANNWGDDQQAIRDISFYYKGSKLSKTASDFTTYNSSEYSTTYDSDYVFDTSLDQDGSSDDASWITEASNPTDQRLICVFDDEITFDEVRINNYHHSGTITNRGIKNVVIHISSDSITSTTYEDTITNKQRIFEGVIPQHITSDVADDITLILFQAPALAAAAGLHLEPDTAPYTGTTLTTENGIIDGEKWSGQTGDTSWLATYSYGVDLGSAKTINKLKVYCYHGGSSALYTYYGTAYDSVAVYKSDDNSTWEFIQQFDAPPVTFAEAYHCEITLEFSRQTARYFKVVALENNIAFAGGMTARVHEVETYAPVILPHTRVWDANYKAVYHMNQDPSGGTDCIRDSISNNHPGTPNGTMLSEDLVSGRLGKALDLEGTDDYIQIANHTDFSGIGTGDFNICGDFNLDVLTSGVPFSIGSYVDGAMIYLNAATIIVYVANTYGIWTWSGTSTETNYFIEVKRVSGTVTVLVDNTALTLSSGTATLNGSVSTTAGMRIGYGYAGSANHELNGRIGQVFFSYDGRSSAYSKAMHNAVSNNLLTITEKT